MCMRSCRTPSIRTRFVGTTDNRILARWVFLACLLLVGFASGAQAALPGVVPYQFHAKRWSVDNGLPQVTVAALAQDRQGFIWAGTQDGLARFDGVQFKVFDSSNTPALTGNRIAALAADGDGRLWIATNRGLAVRIDGRFQELPAQPDMGAIFALAASDGGVWIAARHGVFRIDRGQLRARAAAGWGKRSASHLALDPQGHLWVAANGGVYGPGSGAEHFRFHALPEAGVAVMSLAWFDGNLWVGTNHGLYKLAGDGLVPVQPQLAHQVVRALLVGPAKYLWIGTGNGLLRMDAAGSIVDFSRTPGMRDQWVWSLARDRVGDIWVGTGAHGVIRLWNNHVAWFGRSAGLKGQLLTSVYRDHDGSMLVAGRTGVYRYDGGRFRLLHGASDLANPLAHGVLRTQDGQLWIATVAGLAIMRSGNAVALPKALAPLARLNIYNLRQDSDGTIWIATGDGLFRYRAGKLHRLGASDGLEPRLVRSTLRTREGVLWAATAGGAYRRSGGRFQQVCVDGHLEHTVADIAEGNDGAVWITAASGALFEYRGGRCARVKLGHRPLAGSLYAVVPDASGHLWLTNARGVYRVSIKDVRRAAAADTPLVPARVIQSADGERKIHPVGGTTQSALLTPDGDLWVPTVEGAVMLDTRRHPSADDTPPVVIEGVSRRSGVTAVTPGTSRIALPPGGGDIGISYASLNYREPGATRFEYRLSGYDKHWVDAGTRREALYTHLPPGQYRFVVRSVAAPGATAATATLELTLAPLFYQTWWFRVLVALLVLGCLYAIYALSMRRARARQALLQQLVDARTAALREANAKLQKVSMTDPLTGLKNRRYFMQVIDSGHARPQPDTRKDTRRTRTLLLMLDVDDFKAVNDNQGHQAGDVVLRQMGALLSRQVRAGDSVIRWGGEEFLIVAQTMDFDGARVMAEKLRAAVAGHRFDAGDGVTVRCTCSIGFCAFPLVSGARDLHGWEDAVNLADAALYEAKRMGKNTWAGVRPTPAAAASEPNALRASLETLIKKGLVSLDTMPRSDAPGDPAH